MEYINRQLLLQKRPRGMPDDDCWNESSKTITSIKNGEILIKVKYLSIDPYMRGRMNDGVSYAAPAKLGEPMTGETVGTVIESKSNLYKVGDNLCSSLGKAPVPARACLLQRYCSAIQAKSARAPLDL